MSYYPEQVLNKPLSVTNVSRRQFLKGLGLSSSALVLGCTIPGFATLANAAERSDTELHELNVFVSISKDGTTEIVCHRAEMGQGIRTSVPQIIAEELEADWQRVTMRQGLADKRYGAQGTAGSTSIRSHFNELRRLGAAARLMLEQAAAQRWQVSTEQVRASEHKILGPNGLSADFGELAQAASLLAQPQPEQITLKAAADFRLIGKEVKLFDLDDIVAGKAVYAQDIYLDDMLIASIVRPPVVGGKVKAIDDSAARKVAGVVDIVTLKHRGYPVATNPLGGVAVIATNTYAALKARSVLKVKWDNDDNQQHQSDEYLQHLKTLVNQKGINIRKLGEVYQHEYDQEKTLEATYSVPYINHSPMETPCATARISGQGADIQAEVWAGTQHPQWAQRQVLAELGLSDEQAGQVRLTMTLMGGAFGRKSKADFILESVELAMKLNKPVKVVWSREDDMQHGFYHSISANYMKAQLTDDNGADYWIQRVAYPPIGWIFNDKTDRPSAGDLSVGFGDTPFAFNNASFETHKVDTHIRTGWVRSVACINNGFALGSFVDELAVKAKVTTTDMWLKLLGDDRFEDPRPQGFKYSNYSMPWDTHPIDIARMKQLIKLISDKAQVNDKLPQGQGWGIGFLRSFGSYVAAATKVSVQDDKVTVLEMHTAVDIGVAVTPDRVRAQMEGAMVFGLSITLMGEIDVKDGAVVQSNFHNGPVTRMHQVPKMFVHILESDHAPGGVGEPGVPPIIPSITNAIYHASGVRIRDLPVNKHLKV
ncbi:xanthine dehydrogenase family protein molybdopterin-binding subunit [Paraferrimonas haliotis]|uniref:Xanthine dehydrogenase n=1 Tax=Paraferrimonas haliotis TaxID=2013866 RepID=A0AA37TJQ7_9GAMM|nr:molybdopterin cofactor-binding domain-containing protein [Paraferrimonas haliotis]GLS82702.1 xanthine dehydrogenase [Paraferrimonas haliotis]